MREVDQTQIIEEGFRALSHLAFHIDRVFSFRPDHLTGDAKSIIVNPEITQSLEALCNAQSMAYSCLFDSGKKRGTESPRQADLRKHRVSSIVERCNGLELTELRNRGARNAVAHFDERLLKSLMEKPDASLVFNTAFSHHNTLVSAPGGEIVWIRVYMYDTDTFHIFNEKMHLRRLREEIDQVGERIGFSVSWASS